MNIQKKDSRRILPIPVLLILIYGVSVIVRYLMASSFHLYPTILIDEPLYISLARSIGTGKGLLYMGQPADYSSILYPLLLSPVFALFPEGANFFQLLQFWSICLMNLAIFPAYALFSKLLNKKSKALMLTVLTLILPDFTIGGMIMSESLCYPLILCSLYFSYRYIESGKLFDTLAIAFLGCLLFATKPGHVVAALSVFLVDLCYSARMHNKQRLLRSIIGCCVMAACIAVYYSLVSVLFGHNASALGLYDYQTSSESGIHFGVFVKSVLQYAYFFVIASGLIPPILVIVKIPLCNDNQRKLLYTALLALATTILGTAWFVNRIEFEDPTIHVRYIAMYIPVMWAYFLLDSSHASPNRLAQLSSGTKLSVYSLAGFIAMVSMLWGVKSGVVSSDMHYVANMGLSMFRNSFLSTAQGNAISLLIAICIILFAVVLTHQRKTLYTLGIGIIVLSSVLNTVLSYREMRIQCEPSLKPETAALESLLQDQEYALVYGTNLTSYHALLDANTKESVDMIYINDLYNHVLLTEGVYKPFVPSVQRGTLPAYPTPDTSLFVIDKDAFTHMQFTDDVKIHNPDAQFMYLITIPKDRPWLKSMMGGPIRHKLDAGTECYFKIFDERMKNTAVKLTWDMELAHESEVIIYDGTNKTSFTLPEGRDSYSVSLNTPTSIIGILIPEQDAYIYSYDITY